MAHLDKFIHAMLKKPGASLWMAAEKEPVLVLEGHHTPLTRNRPTGAQVKNLTKEIAPAAAFTALEDAGKAKFEYTVDSDNVVAVTVSDWKRSPELRVSPPLAPGGRRGPQLKSAGVPVEVPANDLRPPGAPLTGEVTRNAPDDNRWKGAPSVVEPPGRPPEPAEVSGDSQAPAPDLVPRPTAGDGFEMNAFLRLLAESGSSDLHMSSEEVPMLRKDGEMVRINHQKMSDEELFRLLEPIMPERNREEFASDCDTDFAYSIEGVARFRANMFRDRHGVGAVFRTIPSKILTAEALGLSEAVKNLSQLSKGLVLVTGPTGSGKSTTLCALVDLINRTRSEHIITIEDPIEFVHTNKRCLVNQREVGVHTKGFKRALRAALREDPDVVLVGELRDLETIAIAIETAETGHLVFGTLHTSTAYSTIDRIIDQFPPDQQEQIRVMLSESLRGVISQTLCKKIGGGRVAALEILLSTPAVANLIREGKTFQIPSIMQTSKNIGMVLLNERLTELVVNKQVEAEEALLKAVDKPTLISMLKQAGITSAA